MRCVSRGALVREEHERREGAFGGVGGGVLMI